MTEDESKAELSEAQQTYIDHKLEHLQSALIRRWMLTFAMIIVLGCIAIWQQTKSNHQTHVTATQGDTLVQGCQRANIKAKSDNGNTYGNYILLQAAIALAGKDNNSAAYLQNAENRYTWTPLANCQQQVNQSGASYRLPTPVHFTKTLPPKSALTTPVREPLKKIVLKAIKQ